MAMALGPRARSAGYLLTAFDSAGSTNAEALQSARAGERGPRWFVTTEQTAGRGRRQRPWTAPRGNLAATILEVMDVAPGTAATLGFAAGVALEKALRQVSIETLARRVEADDITFRLKWPNDVLAGRQKLSGILLEAEAVAEDRLAVVVGIGVNVVAAPTDTPYPATSLAALGIAVSAEDLFTALSDAWAECRGIWDNGRGFTEIRRLWLAQAAGLGEPVSIRMGTTSVDGVFETVDSAGCLVVKTTSGRLVPISAGDVYFSSTASAGAA
jgi:BirA family biotin operon repressor/biotin-[acetyl-CoA-carboxylase] ligase